MGSIIAGIVSSLFFTILCCAVNYLGFPEWFSDQINNRPIFIVLLFVSLVLLGVILTYIIFVPYYKGKLESQTAKSKFNEQLVDKRLKALTEVRRTLNNMITFEDINILKESGDNGIKLDAQTLTFLHGFKSSSEHFGILANNLIEYDKDLPNSIKARLRALSQFQFELGLLLKNELAGYENEDYLFAVYTLPISQDAKSYIRKIDKKVCRKLNHPSFKAETSYGLIWNFQFSRCKKKTNKMLNTVKEGLESNNSLILNSQSGAIINKPVEPDLQAIYEDIIEAFRKHGYGD